MKSVYFLLLDIGGSDIKTAVVRKGSLTLERIERVPTTKFDNVNSVSREISPESLFDTCIQMIDGYMNLDIEICGILVSGQMGCWTLTDNKNQPLMSIISWQDLRAEKSNLYQKLLSADYEGVFDEQWFYASGLECRPGLPAIVLGSQLVHPNVSKSSVRFHSLISWIANSLVGETFSMHSLILEII